jgi:CBS domain-containing protein
LQGRGRTVAPLCGPSGAAVAAHGCRSENCSRIALAIGRVPGLAFAVDPGMKISALFHRNVTSCTNRDTLSHAASQLWQHDIGCLPVLGDDGRLCGMITDRDIAMAAFLQGAPLRSISVSSVMSKEVAACRADEEVDAVVQTLISRQLHRLPVVDDDHRLIGIISLNDIARAASAGKIPAASVAAVLTAISIPRSLASTAA